jgi:two-component system OmpR family sensor kinase
VKPRSGDQRALRRTAIRLGALTAAVVALIVVALTGVAAVILLRGQHSSADQLLAGATAHPDDVTDPPGGMWLALRRGTGQQVTPGTPAGLPDTTALDRVAVSGVAETTDVHTPAAEYRVRTTPTPGGATQAALDLSADHAERARMLAALLTTGGVGLLLAAGAGFWVGKRAVRPLSTALAVQRRFVADAGHELRTPLTLLSTRAQMLRRRVRGAAAEPAVAADADGLVRDAVQLNRILEDLLLAADPREHDHDEVVDLGVLTERSIEAARPDAEDRGVTLRGSPRSGPVLVSGSETALRRAVTAVLDNAVRHANTTVNVTLSARGSSAVLEVVDDGPGIAPEALPRLFDRFASFTRPEDGKRNYGLGLALVSEILDRHGGEVTARNTTGGGAELRLSLPRRF